MSMTFKGLTFIQLVNPIAYIQKKTLQPTQHNSTYRKILTKILKKNKLGILWEFSFKICFNWKSRISGTKSNYYFQCIKCIYEIKVALAEILICISNTSWTFNNVKKICMGLIGGSFIKIGQFENFHCCFVN